MESLVDKLPEKLEKLNNAKAQVQDQSLPYSKKQELITMEMRDFQDNILLLSKQCLEDIGNFIKSYDEMSNDISKIEGKLKVIKEKAGQDALVQGFEPPPCEDFQVKDTAIKIETSPIQLPTGDYVLNFSALDQVGQTVECVANGIEGMPLIREIQPDQDPPLLWSRYEDYFVESNSSRSNYNPSNSTFVEVYGIEPSLYPTDPNCQRSVTQTQLDEME